MNGLFLGSTSVHAELPTERNPYEPGSIEARLHDSTYRMGYCGGKLDGMKQGVRHGIAMGFFVGLLVALVAVATGLIT